MAYLRLSGVVFPPGALLMPNILTYCHATSYGMPKTWIRALGKRTISLNIRLGLLSSHGRKPLTTSSRLLSKVSLERLLGKGFLRPSVLLFVAADPSEGDAEPLPGLPTPIHPFSPTPRMIYFLFSSPPSLLPPPFPHPCLCIVDILPEHAREKEGESGVGSCSSAFSLFSLPPRRQGQRKLFSRLPGTSFAKKKLRK